MIDNPHPALFPPRENCTLWRYVDLTKLLSLLETGTLHFSRVDQFEDPYEGMPSQAVIRLLRNPDTSGGYPVNQVDHLLRITEEMRRQVFVNCWCAGEHESAAMWGLYLRSEQGVAIRTDHDSLVKVLEASPIRMRTTLVQYADYERTPTPLTNMFSPFVFKRESFSHERELRAIIWSSEDVNVSQIPNGSTSLRVDVKPNELIHAIHVFPSAPSWFGELVELLMKRYGLPCPVVRSNLYDRPSY